MKTIGSTMRIARSQHDRHAGACRLRITGSSRVFCTTSAPSGKLLNRTRLATMDPMDRLRIDKWLWCARFYKTRTLAAEEIGKGRVDVNGQEAKPAREVKVGDTVAMRRDSVTRTVVVKGLSGTRSPAPVAQQLYEETAQSLRLREQAAQQRRDAPEPALSIEHGRPTKRGRRELDDAQRGWGDRWSASVDDDR